jgi:hypothetical protein
MMRSSFTMISGHPLAKFVADALIGAFLFVGLTIALLGPSTAAGLLSSGPDRSDATRNLSAATGFNDPLTMLMVMAVAFSALFALNLAFVRHIGRTEARARARAGKATRVSTRFD